jgi:hypothetical protein
MPFDGLGLKAIRHKSLKRILWALMFGLVASTSIHAQPAHEVVVDKVDLRYPGLKWAMEMDLPGFIYEAPWRFNPFSGMATCRLFLKGESSPPLGVILGVSPIPKGGADASVMPSWIAVIEKEQRMPKGKWKTGEGRHERKWEELPDHSSGSGPGLESLGRASPSGRPGGEYAWVGRGGFHEGKSRSHEIHVYSRDGYLAYALLTQDWVSDRKEWERVLNSVCFVELPDEATAWTRSGNNISNDVLHFSIYAPKGMTFQPDKRGVLAEGKDASGVLSIKFKVERCNLSEEGSLLRDLKAAAEKQGFLRSPSKEGPLKTVDGKPCVWLTAMNETLACSWMAFTRDGVRYLFVCQSPLDQEKEPRDCLAAIGSSFRWDPS